MTATVQRCMLSWQEKERKAQQAWTSKRATAVPSGLKLNLRSCKLLQTRVWIVCKNLRRLKASLTPSGPASFDSSHMWMKIFYNDKMPQGQMHIRPVHLQGWLLSKIMDACRYQNGKIIFRKVSNSLWWNFWNSFMEFAVFSWPIGNGGNLMTFM